MTILCGRTEADLLRRPLGLLIQSVSQTADDTQNLNLSAGRKRYAQYYIAFNLRRASLRSVLRRRFRGDLDWHKGRCRFLLGHRICDDRLLVKPSGADLASWYPANHSTLYTTYSPTGQTGGSNFSLNSS